MEGLMFRCSISGNYVIVSQYSKLLTLLPTLRVMGQLTQTVGGSRLWKITQTSHEKADKFPKNSNNCAQNCSKIM